MVGPDAGGSRIAGAIDLGGAIPPLRVDQWHHGEPQLTILQ